MRMSSYRFLKAHLYDKPHLYEPSFRKIQPYLLLLKSFESLEHLVDFTRTHGPAIRQRLKKALLRLASQYRYLRPAIIEALMFIGWDDLTAKYGTGAGFSESYWDLMMEIEAQVEATDFTD